MNVYDKKRKVPVEAILDKQGRAHLDLNGLKFTSRHCPDFAKYLAGGWLEEYAYLILKPLLRQGIIRDLRIGLEVAWASSGDGQKRLPVQEFDIVLTGGKRLFIIECKAGSVLSDHVYKLQNCVRNYGGVDARGLMVSAFRPHHALTRKRLENATNIRGLSEWDVSDHLVSTVTLAT